MNTENCYVETADCDCCRDVAPCTVCDEERRAECINCNPSAFAAAAQKDIDHWLARGRARLGH